MKVAANKFVWMLVVVGCAVFAVPAFAHTGEAVGFSGGFVSGPVKSGSPRKLVGLRESPPHWTERLLAKW